MTSAPVGRCISGVGLKPEHVLTILAELPAIGFFEVHAENYMGAGGAPHRHLTAIRELYPLSIHGVGLSIGGAEPLDQDHLDRLAVLVSRYEPLLVSEHLSWSAHGGSFLNDLLPIPYTRASLERVVGHIDRVQSALRRPILIENPSTYLAFKDSECEEVDFIAEIASRTGCGLLLDVNNVYVSAVNAARNPYAYLARFPSHVVEEIHLAGHARRTGARGEPLLVDSHDAPVAEDVWALFRAAVAWTGPVRTLIERDSNIPSWSELAHEAGRALDEMIAVTGGALDVAC